MTAVATLSSNALTVDLEEYFHASNFAQLLDGERPSLPSRVEDQTKRLLDEFDRFSCRATFFALGCVAERHPRLLAEIAKRGHEIASHGYSHRLCHDLGPQAFRQDLRAARDRIADATGVAVQGYRAPSYSITEQCLWALEILAEEGYRYDSSVFPIHHPTYGIPRFTRDLVNVDLGGGRSIVEFPMTCVRIGSWNLPIAGGAYLRFLPAPIFRWGFKYATRANNPAVLYLHPWEIDADQPRLRVGWKRQLRHYYGLARVEERLRRLLANANFGTMTEVIASRERDGLLLTRSLSACLGGSTRARPEHRLQSALGDE